MLARGTDSFARRCVAALLADLFLLVEAACWDRCNEGIGMIRTDPKNIAKKCHLEGGHLDGRQKMVSGRWSFGRLLSRKMACGRNGIWTVAKKWHLDGGHLDGGRLDDCQKMASGRNGIWTVTKIQRNFKIIDFFVGMVIF